ncbi:19085_t:CDS:1, partial [Dentiscutata erythropus]
MASAWSLSTDFSIINSYSVWSYGYKPPGYQVTGSFVLFTYLSLDPKGSGIIIWSPNEYEHPILSFNPNPTTTILDAGSSKIIYPGHGINMHPSCDGKFSVARFTAPTDGNYNLSVMLIHIDDHANFTHTGGYIVYNNSLTLWEADLFGIGDFKSYKSTKSGITVRTNETIDFIVGNGLDNVCYCDSVLVDVEIHLLPNNPTNEQIPMTAILLGFIFGLICYFIIHFAYSSCRYWRNTP